MQEPQFTAIIIDDEPQARQLLNGLLEEFAPDIQVLADCADLPSGVKAIHKWQPQLLFLDIEMPNYSGLELLDFIPAQQVNFDIIFTTAYNNYASQAFKLPALDYLLKPLSIDELLNAIERFRQKRQKSAPAPIIEQSGRIAVPSGSNIVFIELAEVLFFQAEGSYTDIVTSDGKRLTVSRTLKNFEEALEGNLRFFRCHKSHIVNLDCISQYVKSDGGYVVLKNSATLPISPEKSSALLERVKLIKR